MKSLTKVTLSLALLIGSSLRADHGDCLQAAVDEMNANYHTGSGCEDGIFNAVSSSMIGWGVGLFVGIALLTGLVHNAHQSAESSNSSSN